MLSYLEKYVYFLLSQFTTSQASVDLLESCFFPHKSYHYKKEIFLASSCLYQVGQVILKEVEEMIGYSEKLERKHLTLPNTPVMMDSSNKC